MKQIKVVVDRDGRLVGALYLEDAAGARAR